jgi:hypothetical protein
MANQARILNFRHFVVSGMAHHANHAAIGEYLLISARTLQDDHDRFPYNLQVERERPVLHVPQVEPH